MEKAKVIISSMLGVFGALWLVVEIVGFFSNEENAKIIRSFWWLFLIVGLVISVVKVLPKKRFCYLVDGRDISIELVIGDIFRQKGPVVIGSNTRFETNPTLISENSVQGLYTTKYCSDVRSINNQVNAQQPNRPVEFGTTVTIRGNDKVGYFCAIAEMNDVGVARSNMENLRSSLGGLWVYLSETAEKSILNVPVLGSGFSRVSEPREEIIQEIVLSFIAAINDSSFCEGIRIVVHPKDIKKYKMNIDRINKFLEHHCQYTPKKPSEIKVGSAEI